MEQSFENENKISKNACEIFMNEIITKNEYLKINIKSIQVYKHKLALIQKLKKKHWKKIFKNYMLKEKTRNHIT